MSSKRVLKAIAEVQLKALDNIQNNPKDEDIEFIIKYLEDVKTGVNNRIMVLKSLYTQIYNSGSPRLNIELLSEYQLGICIHILFRMEDTWVTVFSSKEVQDTWSVLLKAQEKFHPEYQLFYKLI